MTLVAVSEPPALTSEATLRFVALGDSVTLGVGDVCPPGRCAGWAARLCEALDAAAPGGGCVLVNLARNGARAAHVRHDQLPWALAIRPHLASVVVGGNDVLRGDFAAHKIGADIGIVVRELRAAGATVLMATMPRPGQAVPLPRALAKVLAARIGDLNQVYRRLAVANGAVLLDLATHPAAITRAAWHIDGIHPSVTGHRLLAEVSPASSALRAGR